jgi:eukaryotic-like serine/threonine-protein kinase
MTLALGFQTGKYEVLELLGTGGMGEVFRARDTSLDREVAIKVLPARFALDAQRVTRFAREAKALAALNHPNIATVYEIAELDGVHALVLELIEGDTLADRIARGPLSLHEALEAARQIAAALEAAHEQSIVHRDLKPANVKVRADGTVKLVDFGLAKVLGAPPGVDTHAATATSLDVLGGGVLGTPAYMSPEQARGLPVDQRADVWSFGCVLFEMLTARRAFGGDTASDTLVSILDREPDWTALPADCPALVRKLLRRCLTKDRKQRLRHIGDAELELAEAASERSLRPPGERTAAGRATPRPEESATPPFATRPPAAPPDRAVPLAAAPGRSSAPAPVEAAAVKRRPRVLRYAAVVLLAVAAAAWLERDNVSVQGRPFSPGSSDATSAAAATTFDIVTGRTQDPLPLYLALSPDGRRIAYVAEREGEGPSGTALWIRSVSESDDARMLPGTDRIGSLSYPFWSPDSRYVAFRAGSRLMKVDSAGGMPTTIARVRGLFRRGSWASSGDIIFASDVIMRVPAAGGDPEPVTRLDGARGEIAHSAPSFLPDGRHFLFKVTTGSRDRTMYVGSLDAGEAPVRLVEAARAIYVAPGYLMFARGERLFAQPFDAGRLELSGEAVPIVDHVYYADSIDASAFDATAKNLVLRRDSATTRVEAPRDDLVATRDKLVVRRTTGETIRLETSEADESNQAGDSSARQGVSSEERTETSLRPTIARNDVYPITVFTDWQTLLDGAGAGAPLERNDR